jgi:hypothetical protein
LKCLQIQLCNRIKWQINAVDDDDDDNIFIYLRAELNSRWPVTESTRIQIAAAIKHKDKTDKKAKRNGSHKVV